MALNWLTEGMKVACVIGLVFSTLIFTTTTTLAAVPLSLPGCQDKCGNLTIPYPFGIGSNCSANSSFAVMCQNSSTNIPPKLFLSSINLEVINISLYGSVIVDHPVSPMNCSDGLRTESLPISLKGTLFTISAHYNSLVVMGCKNLVWLHANDTTVGGTCMPICDANSTDTSCNGVNCCQSSIPRRLQELRFSYESIHAGNSSSCGYVFPVDKKWLQSEDHKRYKGLFSHLSTPFDPEFRFAPLVLEWEFGNLTKSSRIMCTNPSKQINALNSNLFSFCWQYYAQHMAFGDSSPRCRSVLHNNKYDFANANSLFYYGLYDYYISSRGYCSCSLGFEGNPYIPGGCTDMYGIECPTTCVNTLGSCDCGYPNEYGYHHDDNRPLAIIKTVAIVIGSVVGVVILLIAAWKSAKSITKIIMIIKASRKYMFFKRNGGLLLEQRQAALQNGLDKIKLFTSNELAKATDNYNENRILGRGGEGVVYKGMLEDGTIVAVKKSERVNQGDAESFINEVVIVSQINHRNVVKLLGCCLESEVPRVVYEFIPNGTLFHHIHDPHEDFPLFWEMRVRIAKEAAAALAYLHSAASVPIYHRDIKSTNILLDEKYRAKISDFGTSRSVLIDQTHVTTRVVGTFGYLDPEYFQSSQFTGKSDVYSFGVVLVELLTGEKAISVARVEEGRGLAMHFLHTMGEDQLFDIVDGRVVKEGKREDIEAMAEIARKCLHLNGKSRPTMKEVSRDLDAIQVENGESEFSQNPIKSSGCNSVEDDDSIEDDDSNDFSSISETIELHTITSYSLDTQTFNIVS